MCHDPYVPPEDDRLPWWIKFLAVVTLAFYLFPF